jgi:hypothetical protein
MVNQNVIETYTKYDSSKVYALYVNPTNRHITAMVGFAIGIESLNDGNNFLHYNIDDLTELEYYTISQSISATDSVTFLGEDNRTILVRRLMVDLMDDTLFDGKTGMIFGLKETINLRVKCVDGNLNQAYDVQTIEIKNIKKDQVPMSLNGNQPEVHKIVVTNGSTVNCELMGEGVHTVKIKAKLPEVDYLWLTVYPQMIRPSEQELENIKNWLLENAGQPA